ncbi:alpha-L RNA-binding motif-containing protein [Leucogyrophana mollusca]|uniref:Alpha-L RNA-binding motif-containing protein n=1 Tax=Leucogyrophana mollusca TaxID=85980 RepID=A0ACB8BM06_9AGAM|nr:alpha-L RNA-binding motif-containing protein [Leucogyrophana mollusca]
MRDANIFAIRKGMPRMSWSPQNLYNLWMRSCGAKAEAINFTRSQKTLFQQRWTAKALVRAYHGDFINEKIFKRWYLPGTLPDVRPRQRPVGDDTAALDSFAGRTEQLEKAKRRQEEEDRKGQAPVGSLMLAEVERRIDVFMFRCCFAHSVYEARRLVIHGYVLLNGKKHTNANTRLAPGDMVSVDPSAIRFLKKQKPNKSDAIAEENTSEEGEHVADTPNSSVKAPSPTLSDKGEQLTPFNLPPFASPFIFIPAYAEVSFSTCSAIYVRHPTARPGYSEIPTPYDADGEVIRLAWEWYSKMRPRNRSKTQLARMPENRQ